MDPIAIYQDLKEKVNYVPAKAGSFGIGCKPTKDRYRQS